MCVTQVRNQVTHHVAVSNCASVQCVVCKLNEGSPDKVLLTVFHFILCTQHGHSTSFTLMGFLFYMVTKCILK